MSKIKKKHILFITPYPHNSAPSQRFRFEQYFRALDNEDIIYHQRSFISEKTWKILYKPGNFIPKTLGVLMGFVRRFLLLFTLSNYNNIFIHREASPIGPPIFEWIIAKILKKKIIYDFDDAIWLSQEGQQSKILSLIKWHSKVSKICKWSSKIVCGNNFLADYALENNNEVQVIPTTVNTNLIHNKIKKQDQDVDKIVVGWTGSHSTMVFLEKIIPLICKLEKRYNFTFLVISNKKPDYELDNLDFVKWNSETEIDDLLRLNIGLMPTDNSDWGKGKCGFKAIQYMALGIPTVASNVGVNSSLIDDELDGYLCDNLDDFERKLILLIENENLRINFGIQARKKIVEKYSTQSQERIFIKLFE